MKYLSWIKDNFNWISVLMGAGFILAGHDEVGRVIIEQGAIT